MELEFFDCNTMYGLETRPPEYPTVGTVQELQAELTRAGIRKAIVARVEQGAGAMLAANELLAEDVRGTENLWGTWGIVPTETHEVPDPADMPAAMKANRIIGWRLYPARARFMMRGFALREWCDLAWERKIPVFIDTSHGASLDDVANLLEDFPNLTTVLTFANCWPSDRLLRPFVSAFPNLYLDLSYMLTDYGIESFVGEHGASRLLFGSAFPISYLGANMLMVKHARISEEDKAAIASGNLERIVQEVKL